MNDRSAWVMIALAWLLLPEDVAFQAAPVIAAGLLLHLAASVLQKRLEGRQ